VQRSRRDTVTPGGRHEPSGRFVSGSLRWRATTA
jgi:hypothetical protein